MELKITSEVLMTRQAYPLDIKIGLTQNRIKHWYDSHAGKVYVAFSGGKDSTVLLDIVRRQYPDVPAVFVDTGLEYPEIREFVKSVDNVVWLKPAKTFKEILDYYGYPVISKVVARAVQRIRNPNTSDRSRNKTLYGDERGCYGRLPKKWRFLLDAPFKMSDRCCEKMKIQPIAKYYRETHRAGIVGTMAADSNSRKKQYLTKGCYITDYSTPRCTPMAFWLNNDIWEYIKQNNIPYCKIYDTGVLHTGCMFCMFGIHLEGKPNRFDLMEKTHPQLYDYCWNKLGIKKVMEYIDTQKLLEFNNEKTK